ncbi:MAG: L,D-transpeptidase family protein [Candidatus Delongbacteria bacterium]|nr:L,D-transpeptidase family protein [Candidatus Delongbacteria bacterium]
MKIDISIKNQALTFTHRKVKLIYPVSTSKYGEGYKEGSLKTPIGKFEVCQKIGARAPFGAIFKDRRFTGKLAKINDENHEDVITSRILRLKGLQKKNANTYKRYIYIHGTKNESTIGQKGSIGCIRMNNQDIIELHSHVKVGCKVYIRK